MTRVQRPPKSYEEALADEDRVPQGPRSKAERHAKNAIDFRVGIMQLMDGTEETDEDFLRKVAELTGQPFDQLPEGTAEDAFLTHLLTRGDAMVVAREAHENGDEVEYDDFVVVDRSKLRPTT